MKRCVPLEPAAEKLCAQSEAYPRIYQLPPKQGRHKLEELQNAPVYKYPAKISAQEIDTGQWGRVKVYFVSPCDTENIRDVIFYIHGAGWVFGSFHTHEKLVRELAARTSSLVVFPEYSLAPEAKYPVALEQCFFIYASIWKILDWHGHAFNRETLTIAGDSVGGGMAAAMALMRKMRGGPDIHKLLLYYPVTDSCFCTESYCRFAENYYLYRAGMEWFWRQYAPRRQDRSSVLAAPLRAEEQLLQGLPDTMLISGEADVLRSEGEAFAERLRRAGVEVTALRVQGIVHDFVMLNALDRTQACRAAMDASAAWILRKNNSR